MISFDTQYTRIFLEDRGRQVNTHISPAPWNPEWEGSLTELGFSLKRKYQDGFFS